MYKSLVYQLEPIHTIELIVLPLKIQYQFNKEASDLLLIGQQVVDMGAWSSIKSKSYNATTKTLTITSHSATSLLVGNSFRLLNSSNKFR